MKHHLFTKTEISSLIMETLSSGPISTIEIVSKIGKIRTDTTKQAVYAALRQLQKDGFIVIGNKTVSVTVTYLEKLRNYYQAASKNSIVENILGISEGEFMKFSFSNSLTLDQFWSDLQIQLIDSTPQQKPVIWLESHEFFVLGRKEVELDYLNTFKKKKRLLWIVNSGSTELDKEIKTKFFRSDELIQYSIVADKKIGANYYASIIGDYLMEGWLDKEFSDEVESIFLTHTSITPQAEQAMQSAFAMKRKFKMKVTKNAKKAEILFKRYSKYFFTPQSFRS